MPPKIIILDHPAVSPDAISFFHHLLNKFPLSQANQISIEFLPRNSIGKRAYGRCYYVKARNLNIWIRIALGSSKERRQLPDLLKTIGHEYCHALQHDQDRPADCQEADEFGKKEVPKFLKVSNKDINKAVIQSLSNPQISRKQNKGADG